MRQGILIVDGHSMIFAWPDLAALHAKQTRTARGELVRRLTMLQDNSAWTVAVVFDGKGDRASDSSEPDGIHVFYSRAGQTADSIIERLVAKYAPIHDVTVATNDTLERVTASAFGSMTISSEKLRAEIEAAERSMQDRIASLKARRR